jgi:uncharacterized protein
MSLSMYQASIPVFQKYLGNLKVILKKAEDHCEAKKIDPAVLLSSRLYPDMFTLLRQVQITTDTVKGATCRLAGKDVPAFEDKETTFADLYARIDKTLEIVNAAQASEIDGSEEREIVIKPGGREVRFRGQDYLVNWVMANFYFHITTAYAIMRHNGVEVGKMDYLGNV